MMDLVVALAVTAGASALYFLPTIIAAMRKHHNGTPIAVFNFFTGWTVIGWFVALIWSLTSPPPAS